MSPNFDFDALDEAINNAPSVGFGPRAQFGKATIASIEIMSWSGSKENGRKLNRRPFKKGDTADKSKGEYLQISFSLDVQEMNAAMTREWKRSVDIKQSDKSSKDNSKWRLTDWTETVEPSLKKVFGKDWHKTLSKGVYVELEEAETVERNAQGELKGWDSKEPDPETGETRHFTNSVPRFIRTFKSKAECLAAYLEKYKKADTDLSFGPDSDIPDKIISDIAGVLKAVDDPETIVQIVSSTYSNYDVIELLKAAGASKEVLEYAAP